MRLYHFTCVEHLPDILAEGVLRTTESNADIRPGHEHVAPDVVWLVDTPDLNGLPHGLVVPGYPFDKTRVRFTVNVPRARAVRWTDWVRTHRVDSVTVAVLVKTAGGWEAAKHWWVTERPIKSDRWGAITDTVTGLPIAVRKAAS